MYQISAAIRVPLHIGGLQLDVQWAVYKR